MKDATSEMLGVKAPTNDHSHGAGEFFRTISRYATRASQHPPDGRTRERGVRLYRSTPENITLQIRCPVTLSNMRDGKKFSIASASLSLDDAVAIRDALSGLIAEFE